MTRKPHCFGSQPNAQHQAENGCDTCAFNARCSKKSSKLVEVDIKPPHEWRYECEGAVVSIRHREELHVNDILYLLERAKLKLLGVSD